MIPLATTTVTWRSMAEPEPGEGRTPTVLAAAVPAHIGAPNGAETAGTEQVDAVCWSAPIDGAHHADQLVDDTTGEVWEIVAVFQRRGLGQDHTRAQLRRTTGVGV